MLLGGQEATGEWQQLLLSLLGGGGEERKMEQSARYHLLKTWAVFGAVAQEQKAA